VAFLDTVYEELLKKGRIILPPGATYMKHFFAAQTGILDEPRHYATFETIQLLVFSTLMSHNPSGGVELFV